MEVGMMATVDDFLAWLRQQAPAHRFAFGRKAEIIHDSYDVCYRLSDGELALMDRVSAMLAGDRYDASELLVAMQRAEVNDKEVSCPSHRQS
jgi:hypothetical protein